MDKNTLSNYGWIVIAVLVLSVMIALATPFGQHVEQGVRATTEGLFSTSQNAMNSAFGDLGVEVKDQTFEEGYQIPSENKPQTPAIENLNHSGIIPEGGIYLTNVSFGVVPAGDTGSYVEKLIAGDSFPVPQSGDVYMYGDYVYYYLCEYSPDAPFQLVVDSDLTLYGQYSNTQMTTGWSAHAIDKQKTQYGDILEVVNNEPVTSLSCAFQYSKLTTSPKIPNTVTSLYMTFADSELKVAPTIPNSVTNIGITFGNATELSGTIVINTTAITSLDQCFSGVDFDEQQITLLGNDSIIDEIGETGTNYCKTCNGYCNE